LTDENVLIIVFFFIETFDEDFLKKKMQAEESEEMMLLARGCRLVFPYCSRVEKGEKIQKRFNILHVQTTRAVKAKKVCKPHRKNRCLSHP
jgi:hypothetical protein